jgi:hypothetical protein
MPLYPNEMVPLRIDLAIEMGRYLFGPLVNPSGWTIPLAMSPVDHPAPGITRRR